MPPAPPQSASRDRERTKSQIRKTNCVREMEAWVNGGDSARPVATRMSNQLSENITEERMLQAKLWELSRERYKFLSQNAYEKRMFAEKTERRFNTVKSAPGRRSRQNENSGLLKPSTPGGNKSVRFEDEDSSPSPGVMKRHKSAQSVYEFRKLPYLVDKTPPPESMPRSVSDLHIKYDANANFVDAQDRNMSRATRDRLQQINNNPTNLQRTRFSPSAPTTRNGGNVNVYRLVNDPRYYRLESSLSPAHIAKPGSADVKGVVKQIGSLHLPPKYKTDVKPRLGMKIIHYIQSKGIML